MLPALSYHFHLTWRDVYEMPRGELDEYLVRLDEIQRAK